MQQSNQRRTLAAQLKFQVAADARTATREETLGRVVVEKEFLRKKCEQRGIEP
jgi:hypothetical protein